MICRDYFQRAVRRFVMLVALLLLAGKWAAAANVDVQIIVFSSGGPSPDRVSVTYNGPVPREQVQQDLHMLSSALNLEPGGVMITTRRLTASDPPMTSLEMSYPDVVRRWEGRLLVQPFVDTFRRYAHLHLTYLIGGRFKLLTPARPIESGDVRMTVDDQGSMVNYDVWIRHTPGAAARIPSVEGPGAWARLLAPALFLLLILAAAIGATVFVMLRRSGTQGARVG